MEKKGFFKMNKITLLLLAIILILDIVMFVPGVYYAKTAFGTSMPFVIVNIVLFLAPSLALVDAFIKSAQEKKK
ncbi:MAG: hypothetical protein HFE73_04710 [Firmicutes bacterium]|nr:hypothetical protein [Bacillota bacterium]